MRYIEEASVSIFSFTDFPVICRVPESRVCPALILITGELLASLHPILIELPYLPSKTTSPSFTSICLISFFVKVLPNLVLVGKSTGIEFSLTEFFLLIIEK